MSTSSMTPDAASMFPLPEVPPLREGDVLTRAEFELRFDSMPDLNHAELIDGVVYMASAVSNDHGHPHGRLAGLLGFYSTLTLGVAIGANTSIRVDDANIPQPDLFLRLERHGQASVDEDSYIAGAPELVAEISNTTTKLDLGKKFKLYQRMGVREYLVWRVRKHAFDCFVLRDGSFAKLECESGVFESQVFPGLWINVAALLAGDYLSAGQTLQLGLASPQHAAFVAQSPS